MDVAGTRTLAFDEAVHRWLSIAESLHRTGVHKLVLLNAHGGNSPLLTVVATEARVRFDMLVVATAGHVSASPRAGSGRKTRQLISTEETSRPPSCWHSLLTAST